MIAYARAKLLPNGVIVGPGQTALTVILLQAISLASVLLKEIIAPLVPEYTASLFVQASLVCQTANWGQQTLLLGLVGRRKSLGKLFNRSCGGVLRGSLVMA